MKAAVALLCLPALLAGCLAGEPAAPAPTGQIDGAVVDQLLRPFANQTVVLVQLGRTDQTSPLGGFTFREVPVGFYTLTTTEGGRVASQVVDVEAGRITRTILQLLPVPGPEVGILPYAHESRADQVERGGECAPCAWSVPLPTQAPAEVTLEAVWDTGPLVGKDMDRLDITVSDDRGFPLLKANDVASPVLLSIPGEDIHPEARELRVTVRYGPEFLPDTDFTMRSVLTLYLGATKADLLGVPA